MLAGDSWGGHVFFKPMFTYTGFRKAWGRSLLRSTASSGWSAPSGREARQRRNVYVVPRVQRFWLGGDTQGPRIFETRSISPFRYVRLDNFGLFVEATADPRGRLVSDFDRNGDLILDERDLVELGGDRFYLLQGEYVLPFKGPAEIAAFVDVGNTLFNDQTWTLDDARVSVGVEMRFYLPVFPVPLRLIFAALPCAAFPATATGPSPSPSQELLTYAREEWLMNARTVLGSLLVAAALAAGSRLGTRAPRRPEVGVFDARGCRRNRRGKAACRRS